MSFIHPVIMLGFFYLLFLQKNLGYKILGLREKSPEYEEREGMLTMHRTYAYGLLVWAAGGLLGGIIMAHSALKVPAPFLHTYGHGFLGVLVLSLLVAMFFLGRSVKTVIKPKIRERFLHFHFKLIYLVGLTGLLSLATGAGVLFFGISQ
jgi:hypothetical protein